MTSSEAAAWSAAAATLLAVVVALFRDELISLWRRPKLEPRIAPTAPDCHKTEITVRNVISGELVATWPCFYLRIWIQNEALARASRVEACR